MYPDKPYSYEEMYLDNISRQLDGQAVEDPPEPYSRTEHYLDYIARNIGSNGGGGTPSNLITLDGKKQANFNFCRSEVVQNGLMYENKLDKNIVFGVKDVGETATALITCDLSNLTKTFYLFGFGDGMYSYVNKGEFPKKVNVVIIRNALECKCFVDGKENRVSINTDRTITNDITFGHFTASGIGGNMEGIIADTLVYNRILSPQEIQHNLQVLQNYPSISHQIITGIDGQKKEFALATDSYHVVNDTGVDSQQELDAFRSALGEEKLSTDGGAISYSNAISPSKILECEIKGRTVKNYFNKDYGLVTLDINNRAFPATPTFKEKLKANSSYAFAVNVEQYALPCKLVVLQNYSDGTSGNPMELEITKTGINKVTFTPVKDVTHFGYISLPSATTTDTTLLIVNGVMVVDGTNSNAMNEYIPFGLSSTLAQINVDGRKCPFAEPTIKGTAAGLAPTIAFTPPLPTLTVGDVLDRATKTITFADATTRTLTTEEYEAYSSYEKVISLRGVDGVSDSIVQDISGGVVWNKQNKEQILNGTEAWSQYLSLENTFSCILLGDYVDLSKVVSDRFLVEHNASDKEHIFTEKGRIYLFVDKSKLVTQDVNGFKQWLSENNVSIIYQTSNPTTTTIDKRAMPHIPVSNTQINISAGEAVAPSSFKVTVPTTTKLESISSLEVAVASMQKQINDLQNP